MITKQPAGIERAEVKVAGRRKATRASRQEALCWMTSGVETWSAMRINSGEFMFYFWRWAYLFGRPVPF